MTIPNYSGNPDHKQLISDMGITIAHLDDGRIQLLHTFSKAKSIVDGEEGLVFMQEMLELARLQSLDTLPKAVIYTTPGGQRVVLSAGPAHFGKQLRGDDKVSGRVGVADPLRACSALKNPESLKGRIAIVQRGDCMFVDKARRIMEAGAIGGIVVDNNADSAMSSSPMFAMSGDGTDDVAIPCVFLFSRDAWKLLNSLTQHPTTIVTIADRHATGQSDTTDKGEPDDPSTLEKIKGSVQNFLFSQRLGKGEIEQVDVSVEGNHDVIRISRRDGDAYLSSEGTAVVPPPPPPPPRGGDALVTTEEGEAGPPARIPSIVEEREDGSHVRVHMEEGVHVGDDLVIRRRHKLSDEL